MDIRVPVLVKDPEVADFKDVAPTEGFTIKGEDFFLDGPVSRRIAVVDFDESGALRPGARFSPQESRTAWDYELPNGVGDLYHEAFIQVAVFAGVFKTLKMFEENDALGRLVDWAFDRPQLMVVPRAGEMANAFYERESRSLQFFYVTPAGAGHRPVYTALSQDIIAHETTHAVIDGVAPDLYDATHPQGLAIHEAVADLATVLMAFRSRELAARTLEMTGDRIDNPSAFTRIAEQLAGAMGRGGHALRDIANDKTLPGLRPDEAVSPHALSEVLSGALYSVMVSIYEELRGLDPAHPEQDEALAVRSEVEQWSRSSDPSVEKYQSGQPERASSGRALFIATERFKRMLVRTLDYLPPGEVDFADFARALIASDQASHPDSHEPRERLITEFVRRGIVKNRRALAMKTNFEHPAVRRLELAELVHSDWYAYRFAAANRKLLGIPPKIPFEVRPRLDVTKSTYHRDAGRVEVRECLFKVAWTETEDSSLGPRAPTKLRVQRGTTLAILWPRKNEDRAPSVRAVVTGRFTPAARQARAAFVTDLAARGLLKIGDAGVGPDGRPLKGAVLAEEVAGTLRIRSSARALHIVGGRP